MENLLERNVEKEMGTNRGAGVVNAIIAIVLAVVLIFGAAVPITNDMVSAASLTGTNATVAGVVVTLLIIVPIVLISQLL